MSKTDHGAPLGDEQAGRSHCLPASFRSTTQFFTTRFTQRDIDASRNLPTTLYPTVQ